MLDTMLQYVLNYSLVFYFGIGTIDRDIEEVLDKSFHISENYSYHFLKWHKSVSESKWYHTVVE